MTKQTQLIRCFGLGRMYRANGRSASLCDIPLFWLISNISKGKDTARTLELVTATAS